MKNPWKNEGKMSFLNTKIVSNFTDIVRTVYIFQNMFVRPRLIKFGISF
jgi:hypothetical protein